MAATGKTPILLYGSTTATNTPSAGNLTNSSDGCEIAINVTDKNLFFKDNTNTVNTVPIRQSSASSNGWLSSTDWTTFNSKVSSQWTTTGSDIYYNSGNVGIGNTSPGTYGKFSVTGSLGTVAIDDNGLQLSFSRPADNYISAPYGGFNYLGSAHTFWNSAQSLQILTASGASGNVTVNTGNLVIGTSGKGIDFSATAGTGTSELLADYEEGTFTPAIYGTDSAGVGTYAANGQVGTYTKIGNRVLFNIWLSWTAHTGTGFIRISGLPFTSNSSASNFAFLSCYSDGLTLNANSYLMGYIANNSNIVAPQQVVTGGGTSTSVSMDTAATIGISGVYRV